MYHFKRIKIHYVRYNIFLKLKINFCMQYRGVQRRMVLVINCYFFFLFDVVFDLAQYGGFTWPVLTANSIWKSFLKYE